MVVAAALALTFLAACRTSRTTRPEPSGVPAVDALPVRAQVTAVVDGDTLRVHDRTGRRLGRVRLLGIDAPELAHFPDGAQCYAEQASAMLDRLLPAHSEVTLIADRTQPDRDRYGRLLRYVEVKRSRDRTTAAPRGTAAGKRSGIDVGRVLLYRGAARLYSAGSRLTRDTGYRAAADHARAAGVGLWGRC